MIAALETGDTACDVCLEEVAQAERASVRLALQTVSASAISLQQQSANYSFDAKFSEIEALLADARQRLHDGDTNTAQALVDHARELTNQIERHTRLNEAGYSHPFSVVGVLTQDSVFDLSINRQVATVVYHAGQPLSQMVNDRVLGVHAEDLYRRAPPSDEASYLNNIHNLTFQSRRLPYLYAQSFFVLTRSWKYTGVDRTPRYFV